MCLPCSYQAVQEGELVSLGLPLVGTTEVVEDVADMLIEELLLEHAHGEGGRRHSTSE